MNDNIQNGYLDIVFANKNKAYGAYDLRKNYDKRMMMSALFLSLGVLLFVGWSKMAPASASPEIIEPSTHGPVVVIHDINPPAKPLEPKIEQPKKEAGRTAKTQNFAKTEVVKDDALTKPALKALDKDALAGPVDNPGLIDGKAIAMDKSLNEGGEPTDLMSRRGVEDGDPKAKEEPKVSDEPLAIVSQMPAFPGGAAALEKYLNNNLRYPGFALSSDIQGTVHLSFVVNTDGSIVDIKVLRKVAGGCSEEAVRVVKGMPNWKAGVNNGHKVRVRMTMPIKFAIRG